jgi:hypothetical protein
LTLQWVARQGSRSLFTGTMIKFRGMSRAFVNEDAGREPLDRYPLPAREDPGYSLAAARALLRGADQGDTPGAEAATGYYFGDPALRKEVEQILVEAVEDGDDRLEQLAERFLRRAAARARP